MDLLHLVAQVVCSSKDHRRVMYRLIKDRDVISVHGNECRFRSNKKKFKIFKI